MAKRVTLCLILIFIIASFTGCIQSSNSGISKLDEPTQLMNEMELENSNLSKQLDEANNTILELLSQLNETSSQLDEANNTLLELLSQLNETSSQLDGANNTLLELLSQLNETSSLLDEAGNTILELLSQLNETSSQLDGTNNTLLELLSQLNETSSHLDEANNTLLELLSQLNETSSHLDEANNTILELQVLLNTSNESTSSMYSPLIFESYNRTGSFMNHANWNGGLWDRVIFDDAGIPLVQYSDGLKYVPTTAFHWGLVSISKWMTFGNQSNFDNAMDVAIWAVQNQSENGGWAWYFNHSFSGGVLGDMHSGWYGGMTQGLGMSFLTRMYAETGNETFKDAALNATQLLTIPVDQGGVLREYNGHPWYEEYPTPDAGSFVLNGYIYSLIGLYDMWMEFNSTEAGDLYQNGTNSLYAMIGLFDLGCASSYDLVHHSVPGTAPNIARDGYHNLHITLLSVMNIFENNGFQTIEYRWIEYANGICFASPNGANQNN